MRTYILLVVMLLGAAGCIKEKPSVTDPCAGVFCTTVPTVVKVHFTNAAGDSVVFDDFYTTRTSTGEVIRNNSPVYEPAGTYTVLGHLYKDALFPNTEKFVFTGIKEGKVIAEETFLIEGNCCGIYSADDGRHVILP